MTQRLKTHVIGPKLEKFLDSGAIFKLIDSEQFLVCSDIAENNASGCFFLSNFYNTSFTNYNYLTTELMDRAELLEFCAPILNSGLKLEEVSNFDREYQLDVARCIAEIKDEKSEVQKLVAVSMAKYEKCSESHPISALLRLLGINGNIYGAWSGDKGFLGVSPEPLFYNYISNSSQALWKSRALAGTISVEEGDYKNTILSDQKELHEHKLVIDDLVGKLANEKTKIVTGETEVFKFGPIAHLKTDISFSFEHELSLKGLTQKLSPSAALGGYPSIKGRHFLRQLEYFQYEKDARLFGGVIGIDFQGLKQSLVMIRNVFWDKNLVTIHSGTGIVADSDIEKETKEILLKRNSILDVLRGEGFHA